MRVSYPELLILCERVLQAKGFPLGSAVEGAEMIVWAEIAGFDGLKRLVEKLDQLDESQPKEIQITSESPHLTIIDGVNQTDLLSARLAADLAYSKATTNGFGIVEVINCQGDDWVAQNASQVAKRGISCMIRWGNYIAVAHPDTEQPRIMEKSLQQKNPNSILVICSKSSYQEEVEQQVIREPHQLQEYWDESIQNGLEVDPMIWGRLVQEKDDVLVESTEISRLKGTGEQA